MLKRKIDKKTYEALPEAIQAEYELDGEDYILQAEGEDLSALKNAKEHEKAARQKVEKELRDLKEAEEAKIKKATEKAREDALKEARENSDIEALEKSWKAKYDAMVKTKDGEIAALNGAAKETTVTALAKAMAQEISTVPELLQDRIESRLTVELVDGKFTTKVVDAAGQPSALTIEELRKEFVENSALKSIIKAGAASGGGADNSSGGGATNKPFNEMSAAERKALKDANPERFRELNKEAQAGQLNPI